MENLLLNKTKKEIETLRLKILDLAIQVENDEPTPLMLKYYNDSNVVRTLHLDSLFDGFIWGEDGEVCDLTDLCIESLLLLYKNEYLEICNGNETENKEMIETLNKFNQ